MGILEKLACSEEARGKNHDTPVSWSSLTYIRYSWKKGAYASSFAKFNRNYNWVRGNAKDICGNLRCLFVVMNSSCHRTLKCTKLFDITGRCRRYDRLCHYLYVYIYQIRAAGAISCITITSPTKWPVIGIPSGFTKIIYVLMISIMEETQKKFEKTSTVRIVLNRTPCPCKIKRHSIVWTRHHGCF